MKDAIKKFFLAFGFFILSLIYIYLENGITILNGIICACTIILMMYYFFSLTQDS